MRARRGTLDPGVFGALAVALLGAHEVADYGCQTHTQALGKGAAGWAGHRACAGHVATYTATQLLAVEAVRRAFGLRLDPRAVAAAVTLSAATHYFADRRAPFRKLMERLGKGEFYALGQPREAHDDNPTLGTGAHALDQTWHRFFVLGAAAVMTVGADRRR